MNVDRAAGRIAGDDAYRSRRIGLRSRDPRDGRQRGSAGGQMQKISAYDNFHGIDGLGIRQRCQWGCPNFVSFSLRLPQGACRSWLATLLGLGAQNAPSAACAGAVYFLPSV
jgi:hypothetical protein